MTVAQKASPFLFEAKSGKPRFTRLFACISEEEDGYMVQVSLSNERKPGNSAWGEEIVDSFETASELVAALAGEFSATLMRSVARQPGASSLSEPLTPAAPTPYYMSRPKRPESPPINLGIV